MISIKKIRVLRDREQRKIWLTQDQYIEKSGKSIRHQKSLSSCPLAYKLQTSSCS